MARAVAEVKALTREGGEDGDIFWTQVSKRMGGKRGRQQCQGKWYEGLCHVCEGLIGSDCLP